MLADVLVGGGGGIGRMMAIEAGSDMPATELAELLRRARAHYPVSDVYERDHLPGRHWWSSQQEHVTAWLDELDGPGG